MGWVTGHVQTVLTGAVLHYIGLWSVGYGGHCPLDEGTIVGYNVTVYLLRWIWVCRTCIDKIENTGISILWYIIF